VANLKSTFIQAASSNLSSKAAYWRSSSRAISGTKNGNSRSRIHCPNAPSYPRVRRRMTRELFNALPHIDDLKFKTYR